MVALEGMRKQKLIGSAQEARVVVSAREEVARELDAALLSELCIVSEVEIRVDETVAEPVVLAEVSSHGKCERCWNLRASVGRSEAYPTLCERCAGVLG